MAAVRLSARCGLPSLLVYLGIGVVIGEAGIAFNSARSIQGPRSDRRVWISKALTTGMGESSSDGSEKTLSIHSIHTRRRGLLPGRGDDYVRHRSG